MLRRLKRASSDGVNRYGLTTAAPTSEPSGAVFSVASAVVSATARLELPTSKSSAGAAVTAAGCAGDIAVCAAGISYSPLALSGIACATTVLDVCSSESKELPIGAALRADFGVGFVGDEGIWLEFTGRAACGGRAAPLAARRDICES